MSFGEENLDRLRRERDIEKTGERVVLTALTVILLTALVLASLHLYWALAVVGAALLALTIVAGMWRL